MTNTNRVEALTSAQMRLLREAADEIELGVEGYGGDLPDFLAFLLRSFSADRDAAILRYRALQLARVITGKTESDFEGGA